VILHPDKYRHFILFIIISGNICPRLDEIIMGPIARLLSLLSALLMLLVMCASQSDEDVFKKVSVAFRSYAGDIDLAPEAVESAMKYIPLAKSFTMTVPESDFQLFQRKFNSSYPHILIDERFTLRAEEKLLKDDRMQQKLSKMLADTYCRGKFILHVDSDMIFRRKLLAVDVMFNGKPMLFFQEAKSLLPFVVAWPEGTSTALGKETTYEFSRTALKLFPRSVYAPARAHLEKLHGESIVEFLNKRRPVHNPADGPLLFSDFNYLGAYGFYFMREQFALNPLDQDMREKIQPAELPPPPKYDISCQGNGQAARFTGTMNETIALLRYTWGRGRSCADIDVLSGLYHRVGSALFHMHRFVCEDQLFSDEISNVLPCDRFAKIKLTIPRWHEWTLGTNEYAKWQRSDGGFVKCAAVPASVDLKLSNPVLMQLPGVGGVHISAHRTHVNCYIDGIWKIYPLPSKGGAPIWQFGGEVTLVAGFQL
jgi:hypothetical protein